MIAVEAVLAGASMGGLVVASVRHDWLSVVLFAMNFAGAGVRLIGLIA